MTNRRSFIKGTSAAVIALSAGCLDMNGDDENVNDDETDDTGQNSSTTQSSGGDNVTIESVVSNVRCIEEDSSNPLADITSQSDDGLYEFSGRFVVPRQNYEAVIDA